MIETFCKEHKLTTFECTKCQREDFELEHEEELASLREENERLRQDAQGLADRRITDVEDSMLAEDAPTYVYKWSERSWYKKDEQETSK